MIRSLRDYIMEPKKEILETALDQLKRDLNFDATAIDHILLALYSFQEAVNGVLRKHNIKPHWMFALDNLVKSAVQAGITVLSPELAANLIGRAETGRDGDVDVDDDDMSSSGVSTVNSPPIRNVASSSAAANVALAAAGAIGGEELSSLRTENIRLTRELIESQRQLHSFLKTALEEQNMNVDVIRTCLEQRPQFERCVSQGYFSDVQIRVTAEDREEREDPVDVLAMDTNAGDVNDGGGGGGGSSGGGKVNNGGQRRMAMRRSPVGSTRRQHQHPHHQTMISSGSGSGSGSGGVEQNEDGGRLNEWLVRQNIDAMSRNLILMQEFTYEDFVYELAKDDLIRIGLK